jgi:hypothetical protein
MGMIAILSGRLTVVPANEAFWDDLTAIFSARDPGRCRCQRFKVVGCFRRDFTLAERTAMFPRTAYPKLRTLRVPWTGRDEDKGDAGVWAVTCFAVRKGYRHRGLTYPLPGPRSTSPASVAPGRSRRTR